MADTVCIKFCVNPRRMSMGNYRMFYSAIEVDYLSHTGTFEQFIILIVTQ